MFVVDNQILMISSASCKFSHNMNETALSLIDVCRFPESQVIAVPNQQRVSDNNVMDFGRHKLYVFVS